MEETEMEVQKILDFTNRKAKWVMAFAASAILAYLSFVVIMLDSIDQFFSLFFGGIR